MVSYNTIDESSNRYKRPVKQLKKPERRILSGVENAYQDRFKIVISVPMILEYEEILKDKLDKCIYSVDTIDQLLDSLCAIGEKSRVFYLWRPYLKNPFDDHVLELALASESDYIVTYNKKDLLKSEDLGIRAVDAREFLEILRKEE